MPKSEVPLREGLKYMLVNIANAYILAGAAKLSEEAWAAHEESVVDAFLAGLRTNGYEIVAHESS